MDCAVYKVIVIGREGAGKSSIVNMYITKQFNAHYSATIGMEFQSRKVTRAGKEMLLQIWDTAGQEKFNAIVRRFYHNAHCAIFVYAANDPHWRAGVEFWLREAKAGLREETLLVLLANKADLPGVVASEEGTLLAREHCIDLFFEVSAKRCEDVERVFEAISAELLTRTQLFAGDAANLFCLSSLEAQRVKGRARCC